MTTYSEWREMLSTHTRCSEEETVRGMPCFRMDLGEVDVYFLYPESFYKQLAVQFPFLEKPKVTYTTERYQEQTQEKLSLEFVYEDAQWYMLFTAFHESGMITFTCDDPSMEHLGQLFIQIYQIMRDFCKEEGVNRLLYSMKNYTYHLPEFISEEPETKETT